MTEIPDEVVAAAKRADHEAGVTDGRSYHEVADHQVRRLIAGAVAAEREYCIRMAEMTAENFADDRSGAATLRKFAGYLRAVPIHPTTAALSGEDEGGCGL